jgi:hypothetical protein
MKVQTMASEKLADRLFSLHKAGSAPNSAATIGQGVFVPTDNSNKT